MEESNMAEKEEWRAVNGFEGKYEVSSLGRVRSCFNGNTRIRKQRVNMYGYYVVSLSLGGHRRKIARVNRLVAIAFIPNPDNLSDVNHKDKDRLNNRVDNLEWASHQSNVIHSYAAGRIAHRWTDEEKREIAKRSKEWVSSRPTIEEARADFATIEDKEFVGEHKLLRHLKGSVSFPRRGMFGKVTRNDGYYFYDGEQWLMISNRKWMQEQSVKSVQFV